MSIDNLLISKLRILTKRKRWLLSEAPPHISDEAIRLLDNHGWIEFQICGPYMGSQGDSARWFSPTRRTAEGGNLDNVLQTYRYGYEKSVELVCYLRVSEQGKAAMARAALSPGWVRRTCTRVGSRVVTIVVTVIATLITAVILWWFSIE